MSPISCRPARDGDLPELMALWNDATRWGDATAGYWTDDGRSARTVFVAVDGESGRIVGQMGFLARELWFGQRVAAQRLTAAIVSRDFQGAAPAEHVLTQLYAAGIAAVRERGAQVVYGLPNRAVLRFFEPHRFFTRAAFELWSLALPLAGGPAVPEEYRARALDSWDDRIPELWDGWRAQPFVFVGAAAKFAERLERGELVVGVERGGTLEAVGSAKAWDRGWILTDVAGRSEAAIRAAVAGAATRAPVESESGRRLKGVNAVATPPLRASLSALGFGPTAYRFNLVVHVLDDALPQERLAAARWCIGADD